MASVLSLREKLKIQGVIFWIDADGLLHYRATKDALTPSQLEQLRQFKSGIISLIQLEQEHQRLKDSYQACKKVRTSPDYRTFDALTLRCEREAFERLERELLEVQLAIANETRRLNHGQKEDAGN